MASLCSIYPAVFQEAIPEPNEINELDHPGGTWAAVAVDISKLGGKRVINISVPESLLSRCNEYTKKTTETRSVFCKCNRCDINFFEKQYTKLIFINISKRIFYVIKKARIYYPSFPR